MIFHPGHTTGYLLLTATESQDVSDKRDSSRDNRVAPQGRASQVATLPSSTLAILLNRPAISWLSNTPSLRRIERSRLIAQFLTSPSLQAVQTNPTELSKSPSNLNTGLVWADSI
ncbi:hypothetical protein NW756_004636 [Fusarium oxysporum]|nr:hypothetical protein NW763_011176 [Fusarium oxysporum]KAJ4065361.1 hypothetical protein NW753_003795 [Fusarium oxysporum]KAJ4095816.1 hypothetical protein NW756_004636 [Fusarium oxysporum]